MSYKGRPLLRKISPLNEAQKAVLSSNKNMIVCGAAGTGKTFLLLYKALQKLEQQYIDKILIIRSAVPTRSVGFLPGGLQDKTKIYELPYEEICSVLYERDDAYKILKRTKEIEFITTSYVRGITLENCFIIVDEFQNMTFHELDSIITRIGENSRISFCGDVNQSDLQINGLQPFMSIIANLPDLFDVVEFEVQHIVRSELVKKYLTEKHRQEKAAALAGSTLVPSNITYLKG